MHSYFARLDENTKSWEILNIFDENSIEKLHLLLFLENLLLKIEPSEITPFSPTIFSASDGEFSPFPLNPPMLKEIQYYLYSIILREISPPFKCHPLYAISLQEIPFTFFKLFTFPFILSFIVYLLA